MPAGLAKKTQRHLNQAMSKIYEFHTPSELLQIVPEYFDGNPEANFYAKKSTQ